MTNLSTNAGYEVIGEVKPFIATWQHLGSHAHGSFRVQAEDEEGARLQAYHRLVADYEYKRIMHNIPAQSRAWKIDIKEVTE